MAVYEICRAILFITELEAPALINVFGLRLLQIHMLQNGGVICVDRIVVLIKCCVRF